MFEVFRSTDVIEAIYFDGSIGVAMEIAKAFPSRVQIEFTGGDDFLLRVTSQAAFIKPHTWVYKNGSDRLEWRDTAELAIKWEKQSGMPALKPLPIKSRKRK